MTQNQYAISLKIALNAEKCKHVEITSIFYVSVRTLGTEVTEEPRERSLLTKNAQS